jgi:hypothetical protein
MTTVLQSPNLTANRAEAPPIENAAAPQTGSRCFQTKRIAHDLNNCMAVLLLAVTSLKDNGDQSVIPAARVQLLENVVQQMQRLVDQMIELAERQTDK